MKKTLLTITTIIWALMIHAQNTMDIHPELLNELWPAKWIADPEMTGEKEGVFLFKKVLTFKTAPNDYVIHISADNRYILYVNGNVVTRGPARGDLNRWLFETVDIASYLIAVENHTAAKVWNMGQLK